MSALKHGVAWIARDLRETVVRYFEPITLIVRDTATFVSQDEQSRSTEQQLHSERGTTGEIALSPPAQDRSSAHTPEPTEPAESEQKTPPSLLTPPISLPVHPT